MENIKHDNINSIGYDLENNEIQINFKMAYKGNCSIKFKVIDLKLEVPNNTNSFDDFPYNSNHDRAF